MVEVTCPCRMVMRGIVGAASAIVAAAGAIWAAGDWLSPAWVAAAAVVWPHSGVACARAGAFSCTSARATSARGGSRSIPAGREQRRGGGNH